MDMMIEIFGYIGSAFVVISMLMSSIVKLRVINTVGCVVSVVYSIIVGAIPLALMNACLIIINVYNLVMLKKTSKKYDLVETNSDDAMVKYFIDKYESDIKSYFVEFKKDSLNNKKAYAVCCDGNMAGIVLGDETNGDFQVEIDYTSPIYRDCSVGKFLYSELKKHNIHMMLFSKQHSKVHEDYLNKMGFGKVENVYVKDI